MLKKLGKLYFGVVAGKFLSILMTFIYTFIISNHFSEIDSGYFFLVMSIINFFVIISRLGQEQLIVKNLNIQSIRLNHHDSKIISNSFLIGFTFSLFILILIYFGFDIITDLFSIKFDFLILSTILPLSFIWILSGIYRALNFQFFANITENGLLFLVFILFVLLFAEKNIDSYLFFFFIASFFSFTLIFLHLLFTGYRFILGNYKKIKEDFKTGFSIMNSSIFNFLIINSPIFLSGYFYKIDNITLYFVCLKVSLLVSIGGAVVNSIYSPIYSKYNHINDVYNLKINYDKSRWELILISLIPLFFVFIFSKQILIFFNLSFDGINILILRIFALVQFICISTGTTGVFLNIVSKHERLKLNTFLAFLLSVTAGFFLIKFYGIVGMLISYSIGVLSENLLSLYHVKKFLKFGYD